MELPTERARDAAPFDVEGFEAEAFEPALALPREDMDALHRAINERRAQLENPEMLRRLRSL